MAKYSGQVLPNTDDDFPFMALITDETGTVIGEFPVRTMPDGEAKIVKALQELAELAKDKGGAA